MQYDLTASATITALNVYPVKSCAGMAVQRARITAMGFEHDRQWLITRPEGRFVTQRELPRLALIRTAIADGALTLSAPDLDPLRIELDHPGAAVEVTCWKDRCAAIDAGERAADWLERHLGAPHRLVRFDPGFKRASDVTWTEGREVLNRFSDAFPWLLVSQASLDDLNGRLTRALPMNRFRPNIVVDGLPPYGEDDVAELRTQSITLRSAKPCARCAVTTTDQETSERSGDEPLRTLRSYRFDPLLKGITFGRYAMLLEGLGEWLEVGARLKIEWRRSAGA